MKKLMITGLIFFFQLNGHAQNLPAFRQFWFNSFLFNPAFLDYEKPTDVFVFHRQQWVNFNDAPYASGLTIQHPVNRKMGLGLTVITQKAVALRSTSVAGTFGYKVPLSATQSLSFGISGGFGSNSLDLEGVDYSNDPTILNAAASSFYAEGNFGVVYTRKAFRFGFALPRLFGQKYFSPYTLNKNPASQLLNQLYSVSYTFNLKSKPFTIEPYLLYRVNRDLQNFWEISGLIHYKEEKLSFGVSYQHTQGVAFLLGMKAGQRLRFSYSFELPPVETNLRSTTSHELQLRLQLVKRKRGKAEED